MSIFDDIPLPIGTEYYSKRILDWNPKLQKYLVLHYIDSSKGEATEKWLPRTVVERHHAAFQCEGLDLTTIHRASPRNTRFYSRNPRERQ